MSDNYKAFLALVRLGIGHSASDIPDVFEWPTVQTLAFQHGLSAVVLDGIDRLPDNKRPSKDIALQWIGEVMKEYEYRYESYKKAIAELAGFYNAHDHRMMVLKGYACSLDWPKPEHRPCGDIDIWVFGEQKFADALLIDKKNIEVDYSHHHHTVFYWKGFMVENHYDFLNVHHHKSNVELEAILKELGKDNSHYLVLNGEWLYIPSANLHALFLLRHMMSNFASTGMLLRQLLDWAFLVEKHRAEIDWKWLDEILVHFGMKPLFDLFNAICLEDLGFDVHLFPDLQFDTNLKERVLNDILMPEFSKKEKGGVIRRIFFKYSRWKSNLWKHELCFSDSSLSALLSGAWSHILKPKTI